MPEKKGTVESPALIESVVEDEAVISTRNNLPIAKLIAVQQEKSRPKFGSAKGLFVMAEDFNEPLNDFDEYRK